MRVPLTRVYHAQKPSFWQRQHANLACCREPNLIFALLTAQKIFSINSSRDKKLLPQFRKIVCLVFGVLRTHFSYHRRGNVIAQTAPRLWQPPQMSFRGAKRRGNPLNRNENTVAVATDLACFRNFYRATTLHSQNEMDKTSNRNSVRVLAWCVRLWRKRINEHLFKAYLLTECAYSKCEPQGGENMSAELDDKYENAWHSVA